MDFATHRRPGRTRPRVEALESRNLLSAAGTLDSTFGGGYGYATNSLGIPDPYGSLSVLPTSVIAESDGDIVVTLPAGGGVAVAVFNPNGTPDTGFGTDGVAGLALTEPYLGTIATVVQANGQIVVAVGSGYTSGSNGSSVATFYARRLNADGTLDTTYGTDGLAQYSTSSTTPVGGRLTEVNAAVLQPDGDIVLVGSSIPDATESEFAAVRLTNNGSIDTTYGQGGTVDVPVTLNGHLDDTVSAAAIQADGEIDVVGTAVYNTVFGGIVPFPTSYAIAAIQLTTTGTLDISFGGASAAGVVVLPPTPGDTTLSNGGDNLPTGLAIQPSDGKIVISGNEQTEEGPAESTLYRLNADGTLDTTFGADGLLHPVIYGAVAVQSNGDIVLDGGDFVARLDPDGTPDATFGNTSTPDLFQAPDLGPDLEQAENGSPSAADLTISPLNGNILAAGGANVTSLDGERDGVAVEQVLAKATSSPAATLPPPLPPASLDKFGETNLAVFDPTTSTFYDRPLAAYEYPTYPDMSQQFGIPGAGQTIPAVADYGNTIPYFGISADQIAAYLTALRDLCHPAERRLPQRPEHAVRYPGSRPDHPRPGRLPGHRHRRRRGLPDRLGNLRHPPVQRLARLRGPVRLARPGQLDPGAGRLLRHGRGRHRGLPAGHRLVRDPGPHRQDARRGDPVRHAGGGQLDPGAGRLRRVGSRRTGRMTSPPWERSSTAPTAAGRTSRCPSGRRTRARSRRWATTTARAATSSRSTIRLADSSPIARPTARRT